MWEGKYSCISWNHITLIVSERPTSVALEQVLSDLLLEGMYAAAADKDKILGAEQIRCRPPISLRF